MPVCYGGGGRGCLCVMGVGGGGGGACVLWGGGEGVVSVYGMYSTQWTITKSATVYLYKLHVILVFIVICI